MARNKVEVVKYPNVPKTKSEIDEEYIVAIVKDKNEEQWYIETMKEAKKEEKTNKQYSKVRTAFWDKYFKTTVKKTPAAPKPTKFQKLEAFLAEIEAGQNSENQ